MLRARSTKSLAKTKFSKNGKKQEFSNYRRLTKANQTGGGGERHGRDRTEIVDKQDNPKARMNSLPSFSLGKMILTVRKVRRTGTG